RFRPISTIGGCFHPLVQVWTEHGMVPIGELVKQQQAVRVWSYNFAEASFELQPITGWFENHAPDGLGRAVFDGEFGRLSGTVRRFRPLTLCGTRQHRVYREDGSQICLAEADTLLCATERFSYAQTQLLYGTLLGDGHITAGGAYVGCHCLKQQAYLELK